MSRSLLVFIGTPGVGSYINAMANSVDKYDVDDIVLIKVEGTLSDVDPDTINQAILDTVSGLVDGIYREQDPKTGIYRESPAPEAKNCEAYKKLKKIFNDSYHVKKINHQLLRESIKKFKDMYGTDALIDISGALKKDAIDILTACLAVNMEYVMLFELKTPAKGLATLYHNLTKRDYEHVILPDWKPLLGNIEFFSAQQNRGKLVLVLVSILISFLLTILYQWGSIKFGSAGWIFTGLTAFAGFIGGVIPILDAWGGLRTALASMRKKKK